MLLYIRGRRLAAEVRKICYALQFPIRERPPIQRDRLASTALVIERREPEESCLKVLHLVSRIAPVRGDDQSTRDSVTCTGKARAPFPIGRLIFHRIWEAKTRVWPLPPRPD